MGACDVSGVHAVQTERHGVQLVTPRFAPWLLQAFFVPGQSQERMNEGQKIWFLLFVMHVRHLHSRCKQVGQGLCRANRRKCLLMKNFTLHAEENVRNDVTVYMPGRAPNRLLKYMPMR